MSWIVKPSTLKGKLEIPPSKSQSIRALLFATLASGTSMIENLLPSPDVEAMLRACSHLGAAITRQKDRVEISGLSGRLCGAEDVIQAGNSGLVLRLIGALAGLSPWPIVLTGDESIRHLRPVQPLLHALSQLGAEAFSLRREGGAPLFIRGPFRSHYAMLEGEDSQPVSGLLIAAAFASFPIEIAVTRPGEKPWVSLTLDWFDRLGIPFTARNFDYYKLEGKAQIEGFHYRVPADFSSLAFPLAAAVVTQSEIQFDHLDFTDPQGDKKVISILQEMGALIEVEGNRLRVKKGGELVGKVFDLNECIDALPILAVVACCAEGKTKLKGVSIARHKECDRLLCTTSELRKMGAQIEERPDGLVISRSDLKGAQVHSFWDHRMALALAVAGFAAQGETEIQEVGCAQKTYPQFFEQMRKIGGKIAYGK